MPYASTKELPEAVKSLPEGAKKIFMAAFNSAFEEYGEEKAFKIAWSAVKAKYRKEGETWVLIAGDSMSFTETTMLDAHAEMRETKDGYLVCSPRISRTGVQIYKGFEVGRPDLDEVRIYRPEVRGVQPRCCCFARTQAGDRRASRRADHCEELEKVSGRATQR